jgi:hypothetical protein
MFVEGKVQRPEGGLEQEIYSKVQGELIAIAEGVGLVRLQPWFKMDLKSFAGERDPDRRIGGYQAAGHLLQVIGVEICNTLDDPGNTKNFRVDREGPLDIQGFAQEQQVYFGVGCPVIRKGHNDRSLVAGLSNRNMTLTVQFGQEHLADVPLEKITQVLKAHDYSEIFRSKIPQRDLSVDYENKTVRIRVCFKDVRAFKTGNDYRVSGGSGTILVSRK